MTVWSQPFSVSDRRRIVVRICLAVLVVVIITTTLLALFSRNAHAAPTTVSFSARLKTKSGSVVPDGFYNVGFKLYTSAENGTAVWSEDYYDENGTNDGQDYRIKVVNGYLSAKLGSRIPFGGNVNWQDDLYLTMNIGGTEQNATVAAISWDGEMSPRIQLTATPYSMNSGAVGGKTSDQLVQLGQGTQTDSSNNSSISINKTGSGKLVQLQSSGTDAFVVESTGSITLGSATDQTIAIGQSTEGIGHDLTISAGQGGSEADNNGGSLVLQGGASGGLNGNGGDVTIDAGAGNGSGSGGNISLGTVNAETVTIGNSGSITTVEGGLQTNNIDTADNGELNIGQNNASSINLGQDTTIGQDKTLNVNGETTIKSGSSDTTNTFQVQNADGRKQLTVDALNNQVKIGQSDTSGTLLVVDSKTTTGDPVGTNGAMYYNADAGKFRCYEAGSWKDCITPLPVSKVVDEEITNDTTTPINVDDLKFTLMPNTKYYYKFMLLHEAEEETTGVGFGVTTPGSPALSNWCVNTTSNLGSTANHWGSYCGVGDASATTTGEAGVGNKFTSSMEGYLETGTTPGDLVLRFKSESNHETKLMPGSFGIIQIVQ